MGIAVVKIRIMPSSPSVNLKNIEEQTKKLIEKRKGKGCQFEEKPIAFGLKAIEVFFGWPEEEEIDTLENELSKIKDVNSVQVIDMRRAIG
jgi:translation elongation factor aEF-1 beta